MQPRHTGPFVVDAIYCARQQYCRARSKVKRLRTVCAITARFA
jgi:hypothetical protein